MKSMNEKTVEVLREIHHECEGVYTEFDKLNKAIGTDEQVPLDKETLQNTLAFVASTFSSLNDYLQWYSDVEVEYASETDRETELKIKLEQEKAKSNAVAFKLSLDSQKKLSEIDAQIEEKDKQIAEKDKTIANLRKQLEMEKQIGACLTKIDSAVSVINEYTDLMKGIDDEYKTDVLDKMEAMEQERIQLTERIKLLEKENIDLKAQLKQKDQSLFDISHTIAKFNDSMEIFNNRVNSAVNQIACKEYMQSDEFKNKDRKGVKAPRYRQDVDNDAIIAKYESGTSVKKLAEQYKMTENGMRFRLKELGVWKDRRYKK